MTQKVRKAVFPVAGFGTRMLPATKVVPKELLTIVDRPLIDYCIEEAREAGVEEFIFVNGRSKEALENYFDHAVELEASLKAKGKDALLKKLDSTLLQQGKATFIRQGQALGLGHAVLCAKNLIGNEPFAVILPDDYMRGSPQCLTQMVKAYEKTGGSMMALMEVPHTETDKYGIAQIADQPLEAGKALRLYGVVEKPKIEEAPSRAAVMGRYILDPQVFKELERTQKGHGGEIQLTDALSSMMRAGASLFGYVFEGERYDCGNPLGYVEAQLVAALKHETIGDDMRERLFNLLKRI